MADEAPLWHAARELDDGTGWRALCGETWEDKPQQDGDGPACRACLDKALAAMNDARDRFAALAGSLMTVTEACTDMDLELRKGGPIVEAYFGPDVEPDDGSES